MENCPEFQRLRVMQEDKYGVNTQFEHLLKLAYDFKISVGARLKI